jgi:hypothetical protein
MLKGGGTGHKIVEHVRRYGEFPLGGCLELAVEAV